MEAADFGEVAARLELGLMAAADEPRGAAVRLLLAHGHWLQREDFVRTCVRDIGGTMEYAVISWSRAGEFIAKDPDCWGPELAVLRLAHLIATDPFRLYHLDQAARQAAADAFAAALGVTSLSPEQPAGETLASRITATLKAAGFDAEGTVPPFLAAFTVTGGAGATVGTSWLDASGEARSRLLEGCAYALTGAGLRVDAYDRYLYVHDPARETPGAG